MFSISVAVGLIPELLPVIVNANLARGALLLGKKNVSFPVHIADSRDYRLNRCETLLGDCQTT